MITTRYGTPIRRVLWFDHATGDVRCAIDRKEGGPILTLPAARGVAPCLPAVDKPEPFTTALRTLHASFLKADGGLAEILTAAEEHRNRCPSCEATGLGTPDSPIVHTTYCPTAYMVNAWIGRSPAGEIHHERDK